MNIVFWEKHQKLNTSLNMAKELLMCSHAKVIKIIDKYTDKEIFSKAYFKWAGAAGLEKYFVYVVISHYDWAMKKIKQIFNKCLINKKPLGKQKEI